MGEVREVGKEVGVGMCGCVGVLWGGCVHTRSTLYDNKMHLA